MLNATDIGGITWTIYGLPGTEVSRVETAEDDFVRLRPKLLGRRAAELGEAHAAVGGTDVHPG
ncbi:MAG TPA: hypothetical protein VFV51_07100, partial [Vicinamibacterales bacterium]|nr:hypothetical protein [Vicinamibacterales bacterium]